MKALLKWIWSAFLFALLTLLTQVGGVIYLIYLPVSQRLIPASAGRLKRVLLKLGLFLALYLFICLLIVPPLARGISGRTALPLFPTEALPMKPVGLLICLMNRHYLNGNAQTVLLNRIPEIRAQIPGTTLYYLDANFPFFDGFPLLPHLSHDDGKKLDLAFLYQDPVSGLQKGGSPSPFGYGVCEEPLPGELDQAAECRSKGYWQYSLLRAWAPQFWKKAYTFDREANRSLIRILSGSSGLKKIFLEPHLKTRLGLQAIDKIRYHGCHAVRHDDHMHLEF